MDDISNFMNFKNNITKNDTIKHGTVNHGTTKHGLCRPIRMNSNSGLINFIVAGINTGKGLMLSIWSICCVSNYSSRVVCTLVNMTGRIVR